MLLQLAQLLHHLLRHLLGAGLSVDVMQFLRIVPKVVELPLVDVVVEMNELVALVANAVMALHGVLGRIFVVVVVEAFAPALGMFSLEERHERHTLYVGRHLHPRQFEECRRIVDVLHQLVDVAFPRVALGQTHDERRAEALFIHEPLVEPAVLAHVEPLVGGVDHQGVLVEPLRSQIVENAPHVVVEALHHLRVVAHVALKLPFRQLLA